MQVNDFCKEGTLTMHDISTVLVEARMGFDVKCCTASVIALFTTEASEMLLFGSGRNVLV